MGVWISDRFRLEKKRKNLLGLVELEAIQVALDISLVVRVAEREIDEC